jgi:hypothetical protein
MTQASLPGTIYYLHVYQTRYRSLNGRSLERLTARPLPDHIRARRLLNWQQIRRNREVGWPLLKQLGQVPQRAMEDVIVPSTPPLAGESQGGTTIFELKSARKRCSSSGSPSSGATLMLSLRTDAVATDGEGFWAVVAANPRRAAMS